MLRFSEIYLNDELTVKFTEKLKIYNDTHPDDHLTPHEMAEFFIEYGIKYLDITAFE